MGPGGSQAIFDVGGQDGTVTFEAVHNKEMLSRSLCVMTFLDCMSSFFLVCWALYSLFNCKKSCINKYT